MRAAVWAGMVVVAACAGVAPPPAATVASQAAPPLLTDKARLHYVTEYPACAGLRREGEGPVPAGLRELDRASMARALAPATVIVDPNQLTVVRTLAGCPTDSVTLTNQDGCIVVLAGPPGDNPAVLRRTEIPVRGLAPEDAARLANGWGVPAAALPTVLGRLAAGAPPADEAQ